MGYCERLNMGNTIEHPSVELPPEKLVMVTGANTGIGYETAKSMAQMGARVYIACRSEDKAKAAIERMQEEHKNEMQKRSRAQASSQASTDEAEIKPLNVEFMKLDLASLQSTMDFIQQAKERMQHLNVLVCNAGIAFVKQTYTEDNFESHFQVNYLSHLLMVLHLLPLLRAGAPDSRILLLSSEAHKTGRLNLKNIQGRKVYNRFRMYANSKAFMVMAAGFLARRLEETGVSTFSVDPGLVDTDIINNYTDLKLLTFVVSTFFKMGLGRTSKQGAATSVVACVDPSLRGRTAVFMKNCRPAHATNACCNVETQEALWSYSLGCLNQFISDDVLKEAFPSAKPELLTIPKDTSPVEEKVADDSGKKEGSSDDKEVEEKSNGGKASSERKKDEEQRPEMDSSPGTTEAASGKVQASQKPNGEQLEDTVPEDTLVMAQGPEAI